MDYEILMPQLSDSMDEGKLILWKVKVNDKVHIGDVVAEVESDKAIMELQCFQNGVIKTLHIKEGESAPVGRVILSIQLDKDLEKTSIKEPLNLSESLEYAKEEVQYSLQKAVASPKARVFASEHKINIQDLQEQNKLPIPCHMKELVHFYEQRFFTARALLLMQEYKLNTKVFEFNKKHTSTEVLEYIKTQDIALIQEIPSFQKALIKNLDKSAIRAVYHIYDYISSSLFEKYKIVGINVWLLKIFAEVMMQYKGFRSSIKEDKIYISTNAHISFAMQEDTRLYMPVFKNLNLLTLKEIEEMFSTYKTRVHDTCLSLEDMQGSNFGISNLGMTGIHRFDAMINQEDSSIAAIGASTQGKISLTLSLDHRLINGYEAALFMQRVKALCLDEEFFKEEVKHV